MRTAAPDPTIDRAYVASGACSSCPYRANCHEARRRVQDARFGVGRQYECDFHQEFEQVSRRHQPRPWWERLLGSR